MFFKADILWELGQINDALIHLESCLSTDSTGAIKAKICDIKATCLEAYGLPHDHIEIKNIERFLKWLRDGGASFKGIRMKFYSPDFRGVHAYTNIPAHDAFLRVPKNLIITPKSGRSTPLGAKLNEAGTAINWDYLVYITIFLLTEMHTPDSKWKPYLDVYPKLIDGFPIFYKEAEKALLKGSSMLEHMESEFTQIKEEYERIVTRVRLSFLIPSENKSTVKA